MTDRRPAWARPGAHDGGARGVRPLCPPVGRTPGAGGALMSREAKVGIFVVLGLVILTYFTFRVSKWGGVAETGDKLTVDFETAAGLEPKANVKMAGGPGGEGAEVRLRVQRGSST